MHIGVFTYYYYPIINGVVISIGDWKRKADSVGVPMTVFTPEIRGMTASQEYVVAYPAVPIYRKFGITVPLFPEVSLEKEIRRRGISLLHAHHPFYIGKLAGYFKKRFSLPLVFTYHTRYSDYFRTYFPRLSSNVFEKIVTWDVVRFMNTCDAVTVATESLKLELIKKGVRVPLYVVAPGIDTKKFSDGDRQYLRKRLSIPSQDKILLFVGRLAKEKNVYFLLRAFRVLFKKHPHLHLVLAGVGPEENRIASYARRKKITSRVHLVTDLTVDTIANAYCSADLFIYASQTETFGRVVIEAMAAGLPVVALQGLAMVDIVIEGVNGTIVYKKSPKAFAKRVVEITGNHDLLRQWSTQAKKTARELYDTDVSFKKLLDVYKTVEQNGGHKTYAKS